jgi:hypothetical protein
MTEGIGGSASPEEYRAAYLRGWRASDRYVVSRDGRTPVERADDRGEPHAWYDGFDDQLAGRSKWEGREGNL